MNPATASQGGGHRRQTFVPVPARPVKASWGHRRQTCVPTLARPGGGTPTAGLCPSRAIASRPTWIHAVRISFWPRGYRRTPNLEMCPSASSIGCFIHRTNLETSQWIKPEPTAYDENLGHRCCDGRSASIHHSGFSRVRRSPVCRASCLGNQRDSTSRFPWLSRFQFFVCNTKYILATLLDIPIILAIISNYFQSRESIISDFCSNFKKNTTSSLSNFAMHLARSARSIKKGGGGGGYVCTAAS